ncbi:late embryogenesis abundant protein At1g64065-like [Papaver somniferum]|uniref:late embryogenesis abundant protein At1g64065-like n=1 Tax=Papaver somniferum TaxID=3469 RepID=UPI000E70593C|nr:late embryogenesis abundant protein At1g64065-like [Papaver somniferum]
MPEDEEIRSLSATNGRFNSQENEANAKGWKHRRKKYVKCCGFCTVTVLILVAVFLALLFTLFLRDPEIKTNKLTVVKLKSDLKFNVSLIADVSMKNPNAATFKYGNSTTVLYYKGNQIGEIPIPPGKAKPRRTQQMDLPFELDTAKLYTTPGIQSDAVSGVLDMTTKTRVVGKMKIFGITNNNIVVKMDCKMRFNLTSLSILDQKCKTKSSI